MNISKKILVCVAVCSVLSAGVMAYAARPAASETLPTDDPIAKSAVSGASKTVTISTAENGTPAKDADVVEADLAAPEEKTEKSQFNVPAEGDEIVNDEYFLHRYSNGEFAQIPLIRNKKGGRTIDVKAAKMLGSDTPYKNEVCYIVTEFLDGTKRYFRLGESPDELEQVDLLDYGIRMYLEGGTGEYYEEVLPDGMTISGWR